MQSRQLRFHCLLFPTNVSASFNNFTPPAQNVYWGSSSQVIFDVRYVNSFKSIGTTVRCSLSPSLNWKFTCNISRLCVRTQGFRAEYVYTYFQKIWCNQGNNFSPCEFECPCKVWSTTKQVIRCTRTMHRILLRPLFLTNTAGVFLRLLPVNSLTAVSKLCHYASRAQEKQTWWALWNLLTRAFFREAIRSSN